MHTILSLIRRHPMAAFAVLAYLLSWWSAPFTGGLIIPYGPALAAWIVLAVTEGRPGLGSWVRRLTNWRVTWYRYLIGPGIIAIYKGSAFALNLLLGATVAHFPQLPNLQTLLMLVLIGGEWEEPGWSGFALPAMQKRFANRPNGALLAALSVSAIRAAWHLPLFLYGHIAWFDVIFLSIGFQLIIAWLFNRSGGSVVVVMLFHFLSNVSGSVLDASFAGAAYTNYYALFVAIACLIALGIVWKSDFRLGLKDTQYKPAIVDQKAVQ